MTHSEREKRFPRSAWSALTTNPSSLTTRLLSRLGSVVFAGAGSAQTPAAPESVECPALDGLDGGPGCECPNIATPFLPAFPDFGVTTIGGYAATQLTASGPGAPLPLTFIDQSNSLAAGGPMNVPYVSSHCLGLNH